MGRRKVRKGKGREEARGFSISSNRCAVGVVDNLVRLLVLVGNGRFSEADRGRGGNHRS